MIKYLAFIIKLITSQEFSVAPFDSLEVDSPDFSGLKEATCLAGEYLSTENKCEPCPIGFEVNIPEHSETQCKRCEEGESTIYEGQSQCMPCPVGTFKPGESNECIQCPEGLYNNEVGKSECLTCTGTVTTDSSDCEIIDLGGSSIFDFSSNETEQVQVIDNQQVVVSQTTLNEPWTDEYNDITSPKFSQLENRLSGLYRTALGSSFISLFLQKVTKNSSKKRETESITVDVDITVKVDTELAESDTDISDAVVRFVEEKLTKNVEIFESFGAAPPVTQTLEPELAIDNVLDDLEKLLVTEVELDPAAIPDANITSATNVTVESVVLTEKRAESIIEVLAKYDEIQVEKIEEINNQVNETELSSAEVQEVEEKRNEKQKVQNTKIRDTAFLIPPLDSGEPIVKGTDETQIVHQSYSFDLDLVQDSTTEEISTIPDSSVTVKPPNVEFQSPTVKIELPPELTIALLSEIKSSINKNGTIVNGCENQLVIRDFANIKGRPSSSKDQTLNRRTLFSTCSKDVNKKLPIKIPFYYNVTELESKANGSDIKCSKLDEETNRWYSTGLAVKTASGYKCDTDSLSYFSIIFTPRENLINNGQNITNNVTDTPEVEAKKNRGRRKDNSLNTFDKIRLVVSLIMILLIFAIHGCYVSTTKVIKKVTIRSQIHLNFALFILTLSSIFGLVFTVRYFDHKFF